jgi:hypothetical protein
MVADLNSRIQAARNEVRSNGFIIMLIYLDVVVDVVVVVVVSCCSCYSFRFVTSFCFDAVCVEDIMGSIKIQININYLCLYDGRSNNTFSIYYYIFLFSIFFHT